MVHLCRQRYAAIISVLFDGIFADFWSRIQNFFIEYGKFDADISSSERWSVSTEPKIKIKRRISRRNFDSLFRVENRIKFIVTLKDFFLHGCNLPVLRIRIHWIQIRIRHFNWIRILIQGLFWCLKIWKNKPKFFFFFRSKIAIYLSLDLHKDF